MGLCIYGSLPGSGEPRGLRQARFFDGHQSKKNGSFLKATNLLVLFGSWNLLELSWRFSYSILSEVFRQFYSGCLAHYIMQIVYSNRSLIFFSLNTLLALSTNCVKPKRMAYGYIVKFLHQIEIPPSHFTHEPIGQQPCIEQVVNDQK